MQDNITDFPARHQEPSESMIKHNLPVTMTPLIGREQDITKACLLLRQPEVHLLTIIGTRGVGKTRLALEIVSQLLSDFVDGVYFVPLATLSEPALFLPTISQVLGIQEIETRSALEQLRLVLRQKHCLLVLDNFEQIVTAAPELLNLLTSCPLLKLLVTSRVSLNLSVGYTYQVSSLIVPDLDHLSESTEFSKYSAITLFLQRAQAARSDFKMTPTNAYAIAAICERLDGLPLAIELAAVWVKLLSPYDLLQQLEHHWEELLKTEAQDVPTRHQTLWNTITWSYDLLDAKHQQLFRQLSLFVNGCTLEAAEFVYEACGDGGRLSILNAALLLTDKSLLRQAHYEEDGTRLRMLMTIREYGLSCLKQYGELEDVQQAHAEYYLKLAEVAEPKLISMKQMEWLNMLEREFDNLRESFHYFITYDKEEKALRLGGALWLFWLQRHLNEGQQWMEQILLISEGRKTHARAKGCYVASSIAFYKGDYFQANAFCEESLNLSRTFGDTKGISIALNALAQLALVQRDYQAIYALCAESLSLLRELGDTWRLAEGLFLFSYGLYFRGQYAEAFTLGKEALLYFRQVEEPHTWVRALHALGGFAYAQADYTTAYKWYEESLAIAQRPNDHPMIAACLIGLGGVVAATNQFIWAAKLWGAASRIHDMMHTEVSELAIYEWLAANVRTQLGYERIFETVRNRLGEDTFKTAWTEGLAMTPNQALLARDFLDTSNVHPPVPMLVTQQEITQMHYASLTKREMEVLRLLAQGLTNPQIADLLVISSNTVHTHVSRILKKLSVTTRMAAVICAKEHNIV